MALDIVGPANATNATTSRPADSRSFGATDTWMQDCSSPVANDGTKVQAGFLNALIGQFRNAIRGNGQTAGAVDIVTLNNADDSMLLKAVQHLIQRGQVRYGADSGAANVLVVALSPALAEYKAGEEFLVKINTTNTTTTPTINFNALGAKSIVYDDGAALQPGDLKAGAVIPFRYDGTNFQIAVGRAAVLNVQRTQVVADRGASTQSVPDSVFTKVTNYGTVNVRSNGGTTFSAGVLTVGAGDAGMWFVSIHTRQSFAASSGFSNGIHVNNSATPIITDGSQYSAAGITHGAGGRLLNLVAGDTIDMRLVQTSGSTVVFNDLYDMTATRLGAS